VARLMSAPAEKAQNKLVWKLEGLPKFKQLKALLEGFISVRSNLVKVKVIEGQRSTEKIWPN
jgi:hypothetical protein